jgi:hypothetical protein
MREFIECIPLGEPEHALCLPAAHDVSNGVTMTRAYVSAR